MKYFLLIVFYLLSISRSSVAQNVSSSEINDDNNTTTIISESYRLPNTTKPISYDINVFTEIHKGLFNFSGTVKIHLKIIDYTDTIVLHARQLDDFEFKLISLNSSYEVLSPLNYTYNSETELLKIYAEDEILELEPDEEYLLDISYKGQLRHDNNGFFTTFYKNWDDGKIWLAATQFEPTDARHAFPCFDEPALKARFSVSIVHGWNYTAISNMPVISSSKINDDLMITKFEETPIMSTYLVAFVVSNYQSISNHSNDNFTQRVFSRPGVSDDCAFALDTTLRTLQIIENYFEMQVSVPKMDHIGIPDTSSLAMENWGLIIYKEEALLTNHPKSRSVFDIATIICHEYVHQLFGNLVTPKWWTWTWLSESFATFYSLKITNVLFPDWNMEDLYFITPGTYSLSYYSYDLHPMTHYVESPDEIMKIFDWVSYYKGCGLLRMLEAAVGESTFKKGIKNYLEKHQYSVADEDELIESIQIAIDEDNVLFFSGNDTFKSLVKSWTNQIGYPLLTITRNYENGSFTVHQELFIGNTEQPAKNKSLLWWIPINFATASAPDFDVTTTDFIIPPVKNITLDESLTGREIFENDWLILNKKRIGYYRVNYDNQNWKLITNALKENPQSIHRYNKAQLIRDAFNLFCHEDISIDIFFDLFSYLSDEKDYIVWSSIEEVLIDLLNPSQAIPKFGSFMQVLIRPVFIKIGYHDAESDSRLLKKARQIVIRIACSFDVSECTKVVSHEIHKIRKTGKEIDFQKLRHIYCFGFLRVNDEDFEYFLNRMMTTECTEEQQNLFSALACSKNPKHLNDLLQSAFNQQAFTKKSLKKRLYLLEELRSCIAIQALMDFLWDFPTKYGNLSSFGFNSSSVNPLRSVVLYISRHLCNNAQEYQLKNLIKHIQEHYSFSDADLEEINENIEVNLDWMIKHEKNLINWLDKNFMKTSGAITYERNNEQNKSIQVDS